MGLCSTAFILTEPGIKNPVFLEKIVRRITQTANERLSPSKLLLRYGRALLLFTLFWIKRRGIPYPIFHLRNLASFLILTAQRVRPLRYRGFIFPEILGRNKHSIPGCQLIISGGIA
jgi:uncharacterized SAM-binding protein YcdF (DUF218 family)